MCSIGQYTQRKWGRQQRNLYLSQLDQTFHTLAKNPAIGRSCDDIRQGYRVYNAGKHLIFYRQYNSDCIQIVRILHERMNVEKHF